MKKHFLTGLVILLPIVITIAVIGYLVNLFTAPFVATVTSFLQTLHLADQGFLFLSRDQVIDYLSKILILVCLFFAIIVLGILTRWIVGHWILNITDRILHKIPVINTIYKTIKEIIRSIFSSDTTAFKQVVLVPFPQKETWALGLITGTALLNTDLVTVLIPTTPSPISGFLLMYKPQDLIYLDMKPEQAIKYIISCGVLTPETKSVT